MTIRFPELCLVVLVGSSGSGKSTFAARHFLPTEVVSSDRCRGLISDDENSLEATSDAFELLHFIARKRLQAGRLTVIDATNVQPEARQPLVRLAKEQHVFAVAIVFDLPEGLCHERNRDRPDRQFGPHVVRQHRQQLRRSLRNLEREGFRMVYVMHSPEEVDGATLERDRMWTNRKDERGPFDIIGDVHGCYDELLELLQQLGYRLESVAPRSSDESRDGEPEGEPQPPDEPTPAAEGERLRVVPPKGRKAIFLGDLVDRGPRVPEVLRLVMDMVADGTALCVPGNHDLKLVRKLKGRDVRITHGLSESLEQLSNRPPEFSQEVCQFLDTLVSHFVLDGGRLVAAHAGMKAEMQGRSSGAVREFALYGETTGESDEFGLPVRIDWASAYRGQAAVVYGHTPVPEAEWLNGTINIDTGAVFGGKLTALRYPERQLVAVPARRVYARPVRPFLPEEEAARPTEQQKQDELLEIEDVIGKRIVGTRHRGNVTIREENAIAALEVMTRFAVDPRWLIYLPPTMSPCATSRESGRLEHPSEALRYYRHEGIDRVLCEEKHMGSRAVVVVCRDGETARLRFGIEVGNAGRCFTRTGRPFFESPEMESGLLERLRSAAAAVGLWEELRTDWFCLDAELMPWSAKAQELIRTQYAAVGAAARQALGETVPLLEAAVSANPDVQPLLDRYRERQRMVEAYVQEYRRYCWPVHSLADLKLAPFHLLAAEDQVFTDRDHLWHMEQLSRLCDADQAAHPESPVLLATRRQVVDLLDPESEAAGVRWWEDLTAGGGEGMVVKPLAFLARGSEGLVQPAVKCRGPEYLRIIYGPEYTLPEHLERLRSRGLTAKRSLALREFALGVEALERFVRREPLRRVHECVFGVLALESEPVDPRL